MKAHFARRRNRLKKERIEEFVELAVRVRLMCATNLSQPRNQSLTAHGPWGEPVEIKFSDRQPYGFFFTEGQEASFRVPSGHRFAIEQVNVTSWGDSGALSMRLVSISPRIYRSIEVTCLSEPSAADGASDAGVTPIVVNGLSVNSCLFSDRKIDDSPIVPSDTYLQIWGYLEPNNVPNELLYADEDSTLRRSVQANHNPAAR